MTSLTESGIPAEPEGHDNAWQSMPNASPSTTAEASPIADTELSQLRHSNVELQKSREMLQAANAKLHAANSDMVRQVKALNQANGALGNLLDVSQDITILLDSNLHIRRFTPGARELFHLHPSDVGRPVLDLSHHLPDVDLSTQLDQARQTGESTKTAVAVEGSSQHYLMTILPGVDSSIMQGVALTFIDISASIKADARHQAMIGELNHRVRNMLAVVSALAARTLDAKIADGVAEQFLGRLHALAGTYKLLTETEWSTVPFESLLRETLRESADADRFSLDGPSLELDPRQALTLGMIVHELVINACRYGALSNEHGHVDVRWHDAGDQSDGVDICWTESNGPAVLDPPQRGFGMLLLEQQLAYELRGHSHVTFAPEGLVVTMRLPGHRDEAAEKIR